MTITLTGTGGLMTRMGRMGGLLNVANAWRLTTIKTNFSNIQAQFASTDQDIPRFGQLWQQWKSLETSLNGTAQYSTAFMADTIKRMVRDDQGLTDVSTQAAVDEVIRQMVISADSIAQPVVSATSTAGKGGGSNNGDGTCIISVKRPEGVNLDYPFAENIYARCVTDSQSITGATTLGKEKFQFLGQAVISDETSQDYPLGSGCNVTLTAVSPDDSQSQTTNMINNGNMETFTVPNQPDNWVMDAGVVGTNIKQFTASPYRGSSAVEFAGTAGAVASIYETFNTAGQTTAKIAPLTVYAFNCWVKVSLTPVAGVFSAALTDATGTIINDNAGTANNITIALTGVSTTWVKVQGFFRTPTALPSAVRLRIRLSTDITSGKSCYVDDVCLTPAIQLYAGGPYVGLISGATKFVTSITPQLADLFTLAVANDYSSKWALLLDRAFDLRSMGRQFPSAAPAGNTIAEALVA